VHDSYHSAAFILDKIRNIGAAADSMSYWVFTDIFEEAGPRATPFHGGFGLINYQDINKPAFYAYQFLNRLGATELQCDDRAAWVCTDDRGGVQVLFWDFTITHPGASVINQQFYRRDLPPAKATTVALRLAGIAPGQYALSVFKTGYRINDAYATYRDMRAPPQLTKPQVAIIRSTNSGEPVAQTLVTVGGDGIFQRDIELRENDVCLLQLDRV
jgi:xylan 1,4-beta-xylosidase